MGGNGKEEATSVRKKKTPALCSPRGWDPHPQQSEREEPVLCVTNYSYLYGPEFAGLEK